MNYVSPLEFMFGLWQNFVLAINLPDKTLLLYLGLGLAVENGKDTGKAKPKGENSRRYLLPAHITSLWLNLKKPFLNFHLYA